MATNSDISKIATPLIVWAYILSPVGQGVQYNIPYLWNLRGFPYDSLIPYSIVNSKKRPLGKIYKITLTEYYRNDAI